MEARPGVRPAEAAEGRFNAWSRSDLAALVLALTDRDGSRSVPEYDVDGRSARFGRERAPLVSGERPPAEYAPVVDLTAVSVEDCALDGEAGAVAFALFFRGGVQFTRSIVQPTGDYWVEFPNPILVSAAARARLIASGLAVDSAAHPNREVIASIQGASVVFGAKRLD